MHDPDAHRGVRRLRRDGHELSSATRFAVIGHRGARGHAPENTLAGFARALELGVTAIELDVGLSADGVVVCAHDPHVGGRLISELAAAELPLPTLDEACALVQRPGAEGVELCVEVKSDPRRPDETADPETLARAVLDVVLGQGLRDRALLMSFDWRMLVVARELEPRLRTVALAAPGTVEGDVVAGAHAVGASVVGPLHGSGAWGTPGFRWYLTRGMVEAAHGVGMRVVPWTVNEREAIEQVVALDVDGVVSDYPDRVREVALARGLLPA